MTFITHLPLVVNTVDEQSICRIGAQVEGDISGNEQWIVPDRLYQWPLRWNDCEPSQGTYEFPAYANQNWSQLGDKQIIGTKTCPEWARLWIDKLCSPPKLEFYTAYANWICAVIDKFRPYGVEIWNEPDCAYEDSSPNYFGCWYDGSSWYSSGVRYGQFVNVVYPIIKAHSPATKIIVGSIMMVDEATSLSFLRGALAGGLRGDLLSFHGYITERPGFNRIFDLAKKVKQVCNSIPLACSETSVLSWTDSDELKLLQRDYLKYLLSNVKTSGLEYILWYSLANNLWMHADLIHDNQLTPAWELFRDAC